MQYDAGKISKVLVYANKTRSKTNTDTRAQQEVKLMSYVKEVLGLFAYVCMLVCGCKFLCAIRAYVCEKCPRFGCALCVSVVMFLYSKTSVNINTSIRSD